MATSGTGLEDESRRGRKVTQGPEHADNDVDVTGNRQDALETWTAQVGRTKTTMKYGLIAAP